MHIIFLLHCNPAKTLLAPDRPIIPASTQIKRTMIFLIEPLRKLKHVVVLFCFFQKLISRKLLLINVRHGLLSLSLYTFVNQSLLLQLLSFVQVTSNGFQPFIKMLKDTFPAWISNNNHHKRNNNAFYSSFLNPLWLQKWGEDEKKESMNVEHPRTHLVSGQ